MCLLSPSPGPGHTTGPQAEESPGGLHRLVPRKGAEHTGKEQPEAGHLSKLPAASPRKRKTSGLSMHSRQITARENRSKWERTGGQDTNTMGDKQRQLGQRPPEEGLVPMFFRRPLQAGCGEMSSPQSAQWGCQRSKPQKNKCSETSKMHQARFC